MRTNFSLHFADALRPVMFRGKVRLLSPISPRSGKIQAKVFGSRIKLDISNHVDRMIYLGCYEALNTYRFKRILGPGMTVVDAGANIGYFTLLAARLVGPTGKVFAVEPHPENFRILHNTIRDNRLSQVAPVALALGEREGTGHVLMASQPDLVNRTASMVPDQSEQSVQVSVRALDECVNDWEVGGIDLLKIDVDGFETNIIRGAQQLMAARRIRNIIVEYNDYWLAQSGSSPNALTRLIEGLGYREQTRRYRLMEQFFGPSEDRHFALE